MKTSQPTDSTAYVLLEGLKHGNRFFSPYIKGEDPTKSANGETWYRILGYTNTIREAQIELYGYAVTERND